MNITGTYTFPSTPPAQPCPTCGRCPTCGNYHAPVSIPSITVTSTGTNATVPTPFFT